MRDAFLLQMDEFDRLLEFKLKRMLDGVVIAPPPGRLNRRGRPGPAKHAKPLMDQMVFATRTVEAVPVAVSSALFP